MEQQRETAAHRLIRLQNPQYRLEEQECDTIGMFVKYYNHNYQQQYNSSQSGSPKILDPAIRILEHQRDLQHHQEARSDPEYRTSELLANNRRRQQVRHGRDASF